MDFQTKTRWTTRKRVEDDDDNDDDDDIGDDDNSEMESRMTAKQIQNKKSRKEKERTELWS